MLAALIEAQRFLAYFAHGRTTFSGGGTPLTALRMVEEAIAGTTPPTPSPTGTELALDAAKKALREIRDHWATSYNHAYADAEKYRGSYGVGVTDGHRAAAAIARDALSDTPDMSTPSSSPTWRDGIEAAAKALKPFADIADCYDDQEDDTFEIWIDSHEKATRVTLAMCRAARAALSPPSSETGSVTVTPSVTRQVDQED